MMHRAGIVPAVNVTQAALQMRDPKARSRISRHAATLAVSGGGSGMSHQKRPVRSLSRSGLPKTIGPPCHPAMTRISTSAVASLISTRGARKASQRPDRFVRQPEGQACSLCPLPRCSDSVSCLGSSGRSACVPCMRARDPDPTLAEFKSRSATDSPRAILSAEE